jgi:GyrI-like small molecule binding domain
MKLDHLNRVLLAVDSPPRGDTRMTLVPDLSPLLRIGPSARSAGVQVGSLPATEKAVVAHPCTYDSLEDSYRQLWAGVAAHAEPADLPVRERYLIGPRDTDDPDELVTEIGWPIRIP